MLQGTPSLRPRRYASSVLLPRQDPEEPDRVMLLGGSMSGTCTAWNTAEVIAIPDPGQPWPASWTELPMGPSAAVAPPRIFQNAVILPDGTVLVLGGMNMDYQDWRGGATNCPPLDAPCEFASVLDPVLFDPVTDTWSFLAQHSAARMYHSIALLLPDGRVLSAGGERPDDATCGETHADAQIFSPPYLFKPGVRPEITGPVPSSLDYGAELDLWVTTGSGDEVASLALLRPASVTHHYDPDQRYVRLAFTAELVKPGEVSGTTAHRLVVRAPEDAFQAPPGYYMLFALNGAGVPSVAVFLRLK